MIACWAEYLRRHVQVAHEWTKAAKAQHRLLDAQLVLAQCLGAVLLQAYGLAQLPPGLRVARVLERPIVVEAGALASAAS